MLETIDMHVLFLYFIFYKHFPSQWKLHFFLNPFFFVGKTLMIYFQTDDSILKLYFIVNSKIYVAFSYVQSHILSKSK